MCSVLLRFVLERSYLSRSLQGAFMLHISSICHTLRILDECTLITAPIREVGSQFRLFSGCGTQINRG